MRIERQALGLPASHRRMNLEAGESTANASFENPRRFAASGVMSRILHDSEHSGKLLMRTLAGYLSHAIGSRSSRGSTPEHAGDRSGAGVHYVDAYIKPMNTRLEDGTSVKCKRRGLKIALTVGAKNGEGLLRRLDAGPGPVVMLGAALQEAARAAGIELTVGNGAMFLSLRSQQGIGAGRPSFGSAQRPLGTSGVQPGRPGSRSYG